MCRFSDKHSGDHKDATV